MADSFATAPCSFMLDHQRQDRECQLRIRKACLACCLSAVASKDEDTVKIRSCLWQGLWKGVHGVEEHGHIV
ncbi:hypothetical protein MRB53_037531 [Persea americana]|nr:hypothetical protein MRB53_037531 [Persea americana]